MAHTLYFVLNGLVNGERGVYASLTGGDPRNIQRDGHYFLIDDETDGRGPYDSAEDAEDAAVKLSAHAEEVWIFPADRPGTFHRATGPDDMDGDTAIIRRTAINHYSCELEGAYETLIVTVSAGSHLGAAVVFSAALEALGRSEG